MRVILDPEVHSDLFEILDYYDETAGGSIATDFYLEFRRVIRIIGDRPYAFPIHVKNYRRTNLTRFPHHVLYRIVEESYVRVLVLKHDSRDPALGLDR